MGLLCTLAVVNRQGGVIEDFSKGSIVARNLNNKSTPSEEQVIIVCMFSKNTETKYNLTGNIEDLSIGLLDKGQATVCLKEPSCNIIITKVNPDEMTAFIVYLKKLLPKDSPVHASMVASEPPTRKIYLNGQEKYKLRMENIIELNSNLDNFINLEIYKCALELAGYQVPIADAIRNMKNLTTLRLEFIELHSSTFLEIESKELKQLRLCYCKNQLQVESLFKNDLCYKDSLVELSLEGNNWSEIPNGIFQFRNLLKLSLSSNPIYVLPDMFTNLPKLQELSLSHNKLTHLPPSIFELLNLSKLLLSRNLITELPDMFANLPKLQELSLSNNRLTHVPPSIFVLQNLSILYLDGNLITELPDKFHNLPKLKLLSLSNNQLKCLPLSILSLHLDIFDIRSNPLNFEIPPSVGSELIVHSLKELSYRTILKHKLKVEEGMLPPKFLNDLANYRQCICGCKYVNEGQELSFFGTVNDILSSLPYNIMNLFNIPRIPISGNICNDFKLCFPLVSRFIEV